MKYDILTVFSANSISKCTAFAQNVNYSDITVHIVALRKMSDVEGCVLDDEMVILIIFQIMKIMKLV